MTPTKVWPVNWPAAFSPPHLKTTRIVPAPHPAIAHRSADVSCGFGSTARVNSSHGDFVEPEVGKWEEWRILKLTVCPTVENWELQKIRAIGDLGEDLGVVSAPVAEVLGESVPDCIFILILASLPGVVDVLRSDRLAIAIMIHDSTSLEMVGSRLVDRIGLGHSRQAEEEYALEVDEHDARCSCCC